jgi:hypothetical protein
MHPFGLLMRCGVIGSFKSIDKKAATTEKSPSHEMRSDK